MKPLLAAILMSAFLLVTADADTGTASNARSGTAAHTPPLATIRR
jgi:hypothetical protein